MFGRDPDTLLVMTPHEKPGCFSINSILRNHRPLEPFVIEWKNPIFLRDDSLDPEALKKKTRSGPQAQFPGSLIAQLLGNDVLSNQQLKTRVMQKTGMSQSAFYRARDAAETQHLIIWDEQTKTWQTV